MNDNSSLFSISSASDEFANLTLPVFSNSVDVLIQILENLNIKQNVNIESSVEIERINRTRKAEYRKNSRFTIY